MRRLLQEPLLHFALLGALLFWLYGRLAPAPATRVIRLAATDVEGLRRDYQRRAAGTPTPEEERALVDRFVDEEVLYREALALGLDRGDIIVRRRLLQLMDYLLEQLHPVPAPTDAELEAYRDAHPDRYGLPARVSLVHVYVSRDRHGSEAEAVARALRDQLVAGADPATLGDPFLRGRTLRAQSERDLAGIFGPGFARTAMALPAAEWSQPVSSSYGLHLVRVDARTPPEMPALARIRSAVEQDWREERQAEILRAATADLRKRYVVEIEPAAGAAP